MLTSRLSRHKTADVSLKQTIGIDIDDVLADFLEWYLLFHNEKYSTKFRRNDFFCYRFREVVWWDKQTAIQNIHEFFKSRYFKSIPPITGSQFTVNKLKDIYNLEVITSRQTILEERTRIWIELNYPWMFQWIHFGNHYRLEWKTRTKSEICKELWVSIMIEDSLEYTIECAKANVNVILLDSPWNKTETALPVNITRVNTWSNIRQLLGQVC